MIPMQAANKIINGINHINEGLVDLARWVEAQAFDGIEDEYALCGDRPHAPVEPDPTKPEQFQKVEVQVEVEDPPVTLEQVRSLLSQLSQEGHTEKVRDLIRATGFEKLSEVPAEKYTGLMEAALGVSDA